MADLYRSDRGFALVWCGGSDASAYPRVSTITVEQWCKWYSLWIVHPNGTTTPLHYDELPIPYLNAIPYADHVPNPAAVEVLAHERGWHVDPVALEAMIGRWKVEVEDA